MVDFKKTKPAKKTADTSWDKAASWYDDLLESGENTYQNDLILPNILRFLDIKGGERVLDLACGQGFFSRQLAKVGAAVVGVDLSKNLIALAEKHSPKTIRFVVSPADRLDFLADGSIEAAICVLALQNIKNAVEVLGEVGRVLSRGGRFVIVMNHPAFRIANRSRWGFDEGKRIQYRRVDEYLSESSADIAVHPGRQSSLATVSFHRPLQFYFKALRKAGFLVSRLEEWTSPKKSQPGGRANAENKARKEFPLFLALEAVKF